MSEKKNENAKEAAANTSQSVTGSDSPSASEEVKTIPAGPIGKQLEAAKIPVGHLGVDAMGNEMLSLSCANLLEGAQFLRDKAGFDLLLSCSGVDWKDRLESVYHLYSTQNHNYLAIKVTAENEHSPSLTSIWNAADWHERETYDLFGIQYDGHPNLTRILMPSDWLGHPLRKDYKVNDPRLVWNER